MKYNVTIWGELELNLRLERALKQCRVPFTCTALERWDCCGRVPEFEGYMIQFTTKSRKVLKFIGFADEAIASFAVYRKPFKKRFREVIRCDLPF